MCLNAHFPIPMFPRISQIHTNTYKNPHTHVYTHTQTHTQTHTYTSPTFSFADFLLPGPCLKTRTTIQLPYPTISHNYNNSHASTQKYTRAHKPHIIAPDSHFKTAQLTWNLISHLLFDYLCLGGKDNALTAHPR